MHTHYQDLKGLVNKEIKGVHLMEDGKMKNAFIQSLKVKNGLKKSNPNKRIKDILPNKSIGMNFLKVKDTDEIIDQIVEEPLRKACKIFRAKGIETVMSSANMENVLKSGTKPTEKEDVKGKHLFLNAPTFNDAGKGYAWIMMNYDNLSSENQELLFSLESRKDENGENIGEKLVWFVSGSMYFDFDWESGEAAEEGKDAIKKFEERSFILGYNDRYPKRVVILRMPITEGSTLEEVEAYFANLAEMFKQQDIEKEASKEEYTIE